MHRISSRYHVPKARPSKRKMQALLKAKKRWAPGQLELEHPSFHDNDPNATCHASSNYVNNAEVNTCTLNSSELNAATERKLSLLSHTSVEHLANEQDDTTYVLVDTNIWKNLLSTVKCPKCDMKDLNIIKTTQLGMASKLVLVCSSCEAVLNSSFSSARVKEKNFFDINKKMVSSFLRLGKGHAGLELFALVTGMNAMDKKSFSKHIKILSEENSEMKHQILEVARNIVRKQHLDLNDEEKKETGVLDITVEYDSKLISLWPARLKTLRCKYYAIAANSNAIGWSKFSFLHQPVQMVDHQSMVLQIWKHKYGSSIMSASGEEFYPI
ncbi:uncharacterized protein TNIN_404191 [Trichonephila inaurata madagascariensis]|uniref:Mutator-like transposase domain-containing protein n=1 Tax=Trichonephila inaurata madagascariensis TaxID=2747483 RepID=A0A8X6IBB1_9ARAC|nr:uncharacterized protein TNIN_404191 [Trichonephila inaurata madagascariensis]